MSCYQKEYRRKTSRCKCKYKSKCSSQEGKKKKLSWRLISSLKSRRLKERENAKRREMMMRILMMEIIGLEGVSLRKRNFRNQKSQLKKRLKRRLRVTKIKMIKRIRRLQLLRKKVDCHQLSPKILISSLVTIMLRVKRKKKGLSPRRKRKKIKKRISLMKKVSI